MAILVHICLRITSFEGKSFMKKIGSYDFTDHDC